MSTVTISTLDTMLERNKDFAARESAGGKLMLSLPRALPIVKAIIVGCADMRVDPAHVLGIKPGEAVVEELLRSVVFPAPIEPESTAARMEGD